MTLTVGDTKYTGRAGRQRHQRVGCRRHACHMVGHPPFDRQSDRLDTPPDGLAGWRGTRSASTASRVACRRAFSLECCPAGRHRFAATIFAARDRAPLAPFPMSPGVRSSAARRAGRTIRQIAAVRHSRRAVARSLHDTFREFQVVPWFPSRCWAADPQCTCRSLANRKKRKNDGNAPSSSALGFESDASRQMLRDGRGVMKSGSRGVAQTPGRGSNYWLLRRRGQPG